MSTKIKLRRIGRKHLPIFQIVVIDSRKKTSSGSFIDLIGRYFPLKKTENRAEKVSLDKEKYEEWIKKGAIPTDTVKQLYSII